MNKKILKKIAKQNGVTVAEVERDMQAAINMAYENPHRNLVNIKAQNAVPRKGDIPTVKEFVRYMADTIKSGESVR